MSPFMIAFITSIDQAGGNDVHRRTLWALGIAGFDAGGLAAAAAIGIAVAVDGPR